MKKVVVITGTPCSGKTTISREVSRRLPSCELISANDLVKGKNLFTGYSKNGEMIADMRRLSAEIGRRIKGSEKDVVIVEGHLLCDLKVRGAVAITIREHLDTLLSRMEKRGYAHKKIEDNIVAESIDYCGVNASGNYVEAYEILSGPRAAASIISIISGKKGGMGGIDMLEELNGILKKLGKAAI